MSPFEISSEALSNTLVPEKILIDLIFLIKFQFVLHSSVLILSGFPKMITVTFAPYTLQDVWMQQLRHRHYFLFHIAKQCSSLTKKIPFLI